MRRTVTSSSRNPEPAVFWFSETQTMTVFRTLAAFMRRDYPASSEWRFATDISTSAEPTASFGTSIRTATPRLRERPRNWLIFQPEDTARGTSFSAGMERRCTSLWDRRPTRVMVKILFAPHSTNTIRTEAGIVDLHQG